MEKVATERNEGSQKTVVEKCGGKITEWPLWMLMEERVTVVSTGEYRRC